MRVAIDATPLVGPRTGVGRFVEALLPALDRRDDIDLEPYVMSRRAESSDIPADVKRLLLPAGLAVKSWGRGGPALTALFPAADVVHGTNHIAPPTERTVVTVHDCSFVTKRELCSPTVVAFGPVVRRIAAHGGWIHTPSEHVAVEARALFETDRVVSVSHGPPSSSGVNRVSPSHMILALGTIDPRKNFSRLVRAFAAVAADDAEVTLTIAGNEGADADHVRATIEELDTPTRGRVRLTGWIDDDERDRLLASARVLAYPSLDEGFGLPMLEAWLHDVPVVAARAGALPEVAVDGALLVDPLDVDALAGALQRALHDDAARRELVDRGRVRLATFSWERTAEGIAAIYRQAMQSARG